MSRSGYYECIPGQYIYCRLPCNKFVPYDTYVQAFLVSVLMLLPPALFSSFVSPIQHFICISLVYSFFTAPPMFGFEMMQFLFKHFRNSGQYMFNPWPSIHCASFLHCCISVVRTGIWYHFSTTLVLLCQ